MGKTKLYSKEIKIIQHCLTNPLKIKETPREKIERLTCIVKELEDYKTSVSLKYKILRRAILGRVSVGRENYTMEDLINLTCELEGKNVKQLEDIHKKWIGY
mgnify:CR=1 FL=1